MGTRQPFIVSLAEAFDYPAELLGNKARNLSLCMRKGFHVPAGFCISADSYLAFTRHNNLQERINLELYRKDFSSMRWEEIWDIALRIRSFYSKGSLPAALEKEIISYAARYTAGTKFAVRSSAAAEDSASASFAGIHESYLNVTAEELVENLKLTWASLWSDRSLLYREEKKLDSHHSTMPVLVQVMEPKKVSGLAFSADPSTGRQDRIVIELISGSLDLLVDNIEEPERIKLEKDTGKILSADGRSTTTLLATSTLEDLRLKILAIEKLFDQPVDIEWTGVEKDFTVLQVRPVTGLTDNTDDERSWYLTLTPGKESLLALTDKVENELIPGLIEEVESFQAEGPFPENNRLFLEQLEERGISYNRWKKTYWDDFIPFAHGIRTFGTYYNDLVKPEDPYEFIVLLKSKDLLAHQRNWQLENLGQMLFNDKPLKEKVEFFLANENDISTEQFWEIIKTETNTGDKFAANFIELLNEEMNIYYEKVSLADDPRTLLKTVLTLAGTTLEKKEHSENLANKQELENIYLDKAGPQRKDEALNWLRIGRLSWKLRDDDNILLSKLENHLYLYLKEALNRLQKAGLVKETLDQINLDNWPAILESMQNQKSYNPPATKETVRKEKNFSLKPRQLVGQPSSSGMVTGKARVILSVDDFKEVVKGEILVFDAVQPQMTFIISLAAGIVERRGGMLVHSSIIARELQIPAVNGVSQATELIETGDLITLNGDLGLVIIGEPEFDLELDKLPAH